MRYFARYLISFTLALSLFPAAFAQVLETGWISDAKGSNDPKTKATVILVSNLNGSQNRNGTMEWAGRYIGLEIPQKKINLSKVVLIGEDGRFIPHQNPETFDSAVGQSGARVTVLKLFVDRPPGFKFKLRVEE